MVTAPAACASASVAYGGAALGPAFSSRNSWPANESFVPTMGYYTEYVARNTVGEGTLSAGTPIVYDLDAAKYDQNARIVPKLPAVPDAEATPVSAELVDEGKRLLITFLETQRVGFYNLELAGRDGVTTPVLPESATTVAGEAVTL